MAVLSITEGYTGVRADGDSAVRVFTLEESNLAHRGLFDWPVTASGLTIPAAGSPHPDDDRYVSKKPQTTKKCPGMFEVRVEYTVRRGGLEEEDYEDPLAMPADVSIGSVKRVVPFDRDLEGKAIANYFGEPLDPAPEWEVVDLQYVIERNEAAFDSLDASLYLGTVSSGEFDGWAGGLALMEDIGARRVWAAVPYWRIRYVVTVRFQRPTGVSEADAWAHFYLHQGSKYKDAGGVIRDAKPGELVLLSDAGTKVGKSEACWLKFKARISANWAGLGLDV